MPRWFNLVVVHCVVVFCLICNDLAVSAHQLLVVSRRYLGPYSFVNLSVVFLIRIDVAFNGFWVFSCLQLRLTENRLCRSSSTRLFATCAVHRRAGRLLSA